MDLGYFDKSVLVRTNIIIDNVDKEKEDDDVDSLIAMATTHLDDTSVDLLIGNIKGTSTIYNMFWFNSYNSHPFCIDKIDNKFMSNKTIRICFTEFQETLF